MNWTSLRQYWSNNTCVTAPNVSSFSSPEKPCALFSKIRNCNLKSQIPFLEKIHSALPAATSSARQRSGGRSVIPWFTVPFALAAALAVVFGLLFLNQRGVLDRAGGNALVEEVISSHVRSLLATHLLDVPSTDQHTVKPWFNGKLKFSPPVQ